MQTTVDFLDLVKARTRAENDTDLAAILHVTKQSVSRYRLREAFLGDVTARTVAALLDLDEAYVMASAHAERARDPGIKRVWQRVAASFATTATLALIGLTAAPPPPVSASIDIMFNRRRHAQLA